MKIKNFIIFLGLLALIGIASFAAKHWNIPNDTLLVLIIAVMWARYETRIERLSGDLAYVESILEEHFPDDCDFTDPDLQRKF